jgi:hypothetical protein
MKGLFVKDAVDRIVVAKDPKTGKEYWVDIKQKMTYGDQQKLAAHYVSMQSFKPGSKPILSMDLEGGNIMLLLINIKDWNLELDGKKVPVALTTIQQLDPDVADKIAQEVNKRNPNPKA